jgi:hypothetical protein
MFIFLLRYPLIFMTRTIRITRIGDVVFRFGGIFGRIGTKGLMDQTDQEKEKERQPLPPEMLKQVQHDF